MNFHQILCHLHVQSMQFHLHYPQECDRPLMDKFRCTVLPFVAQYLHPKPGKKDEKGSKNSASAPKERGSKRPAGKLPVHHGCVERHTTYCFACIGRKYGLASAVTFSLLYSAVPLTSK